MHCGQIIKGGCGVVDGEVKVVDVDVDGNGDLESAGDLVLLFCCFFIVYYIMSTTDTNNAEVFLYPSTTETEYCPNPMDRCRGCNLNLASNNNASLYQKQRLIQGTVRVASSMYQMNLAALSSYEHPLPLRDRYQVVRLNEDIEYLAPAGVNWNQMSDRRRPHIQTTKVADGGTYHSSSTKHSITRCRPGGASAGGIGVDIKHNSYDRYLNRLKAKGPLRRGPVPPYFSELAALPFNRAVPIYGGKVFKTTIIPCKCEGDVVSDEVLYRGSTQDEIYGVHFEFHVGDPVWAPSIYNETDLMNATIVNISANGLVYTVQYSNGETREVDPLLLTQYYACTASANDYTESGLAKYIAYVTSDTELGGGCSLLTTLSNGEII